MTDYEKLLKENLLLRETLDEITSRIPKIVTKVPMKNDIEIKVNEWEDRSNLYRVINFLYSHARRPTAKDIVMDWWWLKKPICKYVELRIDMRDGNFIIRNREGHRISWEDLRGNK